MTIWSLVAKYFDADPFDIMGRWTYPQLWLGLVHVYEQDELASKVENRNRSTYARAGSSGTQTFGQFVAGVRGQAGGHSVADDLASVLGGPI